MTIERKKKFIINSLYFLLIVSSVYLFIEYALSLFSPFLIGFFVAFLLRKSIHRTSEKLNFSSRIIAVFFVALLYLIVGFVVILIAISVIAKLKDTLLVLPELYLRDVQPAFFSFFENMKQTISEFDPSLVQPIEEMSTSFLQSLGSIITNLSSKIIGGISSVVTALPRLILSTILAVISSVFFAMDYRRITQYIIGLFTPKHQRFIFEIKGFVTEIGWTYVKAYGIILLLSFFELTIGLYILGIKDAIILAALIAVVDILPVLGTGVVLLPWSFIGFLQGNTAFGFGILILYIGITIIRNIVEPKLIGNQIGMHPLIMLISMYVGINIFGFWGLFIFPVFAMVIKYLHDSERNDNNDGKIENIQGKESTKQPEPKSK